MIRHFAILGASGDLTSRFLIPALISLHQARRLPEGFAVIGIARDDWDTAGFRRHLEEKLDDQASAADPASRTELLARLEYRRADVTRPEQVAEALASVQAPAAAYLALPPALFQPTIKTLAGLKLSGESKIIVEKPFGESLTSAQALNRLLHETFPEEHVFRLDHFLGKQTVQNLLGLRFANRIFEPLWSFQHVERVEIIWDETLTATGRASFYDTTGALRDMIQNHLLQLLALVAMEPLYALDARTLRDRKVDVFRSVRRLSRDEVIRRTARGRYGRGSIGGREVPPYVEEQGVDPNRGTETFAQTVLTVDNWRWAGVPFLLRTGKALKRDCREIAVHFKPVPHLAFGQQAEPRQNVLRVQLNPDQISLGVNVNAPGDLFELEPVELETSFHSQDLLPYARLILDILSGDPTLSIRDDEAEESWRIVEPILDVWAEGAVPLMEYPAGSEGPTQAASAETG
jgi:glucose-6-phosphate 1-dehydrogenase